MPRMLLGYGTGAMAKRDHARGSISYEFVALPKPIIRSPEWMRLSLRGRVLAIDLMVQYTGKNNGRLTPSFEVMRRAGWTSKDQLRKARDELLECSFAIRTRMGHPPRTAEWIGFTWWRLDWHASMDIGPDRWPFMNFVTIGSAQIDPNVGREKLNGKTVSVPRSTGRYPPKRAPTSPAVRGDGSA